MVIMASGIACGRVRTAAREDFAQHGGHTPNNRLAQTCSLVLPCTSLILDIHDIADQYHVTISQAQVYSSSRSHVF